MNKKTLIAGLSAISLILALPQAQANPTLAGAIAFGGSYTLLPGQNLGNATELKTITASVTSDAGPTYGGIPVFVTPASFASPLMITPATPASPLWTVNYAGNVYTFDATTSTVDFQGSAIGGYALKMEGHGFAYENGIDKTPGTWIVTASQSGTGAYAAFGFESSATVVGEVPDSGMTLGLLGSAMLALQGLRRKLGC